MLISQLLSYLRVYSFSVKSIRPWTIVASERRTNDNVLATYSRRVSDPVRVIRARANGCTFRSDRRRLRAMLVAATRKPDQLVLRIIAYNITVSYSIRFYS